MKMKFYAGLSIRPDQIKKYFPKAAVAEPIKRHDLLRDVKSKYNVVVIIDGYFDQNLSVSCSEVIDALRVGIRVYGSSSMGAYRAAELSDFGMVGHGEVYNYIKSNKLFRDDYLAQVLIKNRHNEITPITQAFIDYHYELEKLKISERDKKWLHKTYKKLHYRERNYRNLSHAIKKSRKRHLLSIAKKITSLKTGQKHKDAKSVLAFIRKDLNQIKKINKRLSR